MHARQIGHALNPHPALSPVPVESIPSTMEEQQRNESTWCQLLVQGALAILLPTEDLANGCLRSLLTEILSEMILKNAIAGRTCEPWFLYESITRAIEVARSNGLLPEKSPTAKVDAAVSEGKGGGRLERSGLVSSTGERPGLGVESDPARGEGGGHGSRRLSLSHAFWTVVQNLFLTFMVFRSAALALATSATLPSRRRASEQTDEGNDGDGDKDQGNGATSASLDHRRRRPPIASLAIWSCVGQVVQLHERMPWLSGILALLQWGSILGPGRLGDTDGLLDRYVVLLFYNFSTKRKLGALLYLHSSLSHAFPLQISTFSSYLLGCNKRYQSSALIALLYLYFPKYNPLALFSYSLMAICFFLLSFTGGISIAVFPLAQGGVNACGGGLGAWRDRATGGGGRGPFATGGGPA